MGAEQHFFPEVCRSLVCLVGKQEAVMRTDEVCSANGWLAVRALSHSLSAMPKHLSLNFLINLSIRFWIVQQFDLSGDEESRLGHIFPHLTLLAFGCWDYFFLKNTFQCFQFCHYFGSTN